MKRFITLFMLAVFCLSIQAEKPNWQMGLGNFEGLHGGLRHQLKKYHLYYGLGSDLNIYQQGLANCFYLGAGMLISKKIRAENDAFTIDLKTITWNLENKSNVFTIFTFGPELHYHVYKNKKYRLELFGGYAFSTVMRYKRKGYYEVGFPREWMPNFGIELTFLRP